jgi:hypothetical protein
MDPRRSIYFAACLHAIRNNTNFQAPPKAAAVAQKAAADAQKAQDKVDRKAAAVAQKAAADAQKAQDKADREGSSCGPEGISCGSGTYTTTGLCWMVGKVRRLRPVACYAQHQFGGEGFPLWRQKALQPTC